MIKLEPCNRCCSDEVGLVESEQVQCRHCGFSENLEVWQLRGWCNIQKYPPVFSGVIFVYGKGIGRTIARWDANTHSCDNPLATHWLRTPDPTKQINMN